MQSKSSPSLSVRAAQSTFSMPRVTVGLDLSYTSTGVSVLFDGVFQPELSFVFGTTPKTDPSTVIRAQLAAKKVIEHLTMLRDIKSEPHVFVENYAFMRTNNRELMGELGGIVKAALLDNKFKYEPLAITMVRKVITGKGNSRKDQIMYALLKRHNLDIVQNDIADATAVALTGDYVVRAREAHEVLDTWPAETRDAVRAYLKEKT